MSKYYGYIGFSTISETAPSVHSVTIVRKKYYGDIKKVTQTNTTGDGLNDNILVSTELSIVMDNYMLDNFNTITYVEYMGVKWKIKTIDPSTHPRIILSIGGVYNE